MPTINGTPENDTLTGSDISDYIYGYEGSDVLKGRFGGDRIYGGTGDDLISGNDGNDTLHGETGSDTLLGQAGDDYVIAEYDLSRPDVIDGGEGRNKLSLTFAGAEVDMEADFGDPSGTWTFFDGTTIANFGRIEFSGGDGDDHLIGGAVIDVLGGGAGNDTIIGGVAGKITLSGGDGDDVIYGGDALKNPLLASATLLFGGDGDDRIYVGVGGCERIIGFSGSDTVTGSKSSDIFYDENTILFTGGPYDYFSDFYSGRDGDDIFYMSALRGDTVAGGNGVDTLNLTLRTDEPGVELSLVDTRTPYVMDDGSTLVGFEKLRFEGGNAGDTVAGGSLADTLYGGLGDDVLSLGTGDFADGGDEFDFQDGADRFVLLAGLTTAVIDSFRGDLGDRIDLREIGDFEFVRQFSGDGGQEVRYIRGELRGDGNGDGEADFIVNVDSLFRFSESDLIL